MIKIISSLRRFPQAPHLEDSQWWMMSAADRRPGRSLGGCWEHALKVWWEAVSPGESHGSGRKCWWKWICFGEKLRGWARITAVVMAAWEVARLQDISKFNLQWGKGIGKHYHNFIPRRGQCFKLPNYAEQYSFEKVKHLPFQVLCWRHLSVHAVSVCALWVCVHCGRDAVLMHFMCRVCGCQSSARAGAVNQRTWFNTAL